MTSTTAKLRVLLGAAVLLIGAGTVLLSASLIELSVPLVAYVVLARVIGGTPRLEVSARRAIEGEKILEGGRVEVSTRIVNEGGMPGVLVFEDTLPREVKVVRGSRLALAPLAKGEAVDVAYAVTAAAPGSWVLGPAKMTAQDWFGLSARSATMDVPYRLDVLPAVSGRLRFPFRPIKTKNWPGQVTSPRPGSGGDFHGIRPYLPSDPARSINWKATARLGAAHTNQYQAEQGAEAVVVVDKSYDSDYGVPPHSALNYVERCAAGVASGLLLAGNRVGLVIFGDRIYELNPGTGARQLERALVEIVRATKGPVKTFPYMRDYLSHFFPRAAQVIVVSSLQDPVIVDPLLTLGVQRDVRIITPALFRLDRAAHQTETEEAAAGLLRLQRWTVLERLRRRTVVAEWDVSRPLEEALERALYPRGAVVAR